MSKFNRTTDRFPYERQTAEQLISAFRRVQAELNQMEALAESLPQSTEQSEFIYTVRLHGANFMHALERHVFPAFPELWPIDYEAKPDAR